jgi:hypothetical protein
MAAVTTFQTDQFAHLLQDSKNQGVQHQNTAVLFKIPPRLHPQLQLEVNRQSMELSKQQAFDLPMKKAAK